MSAISISAAYFLAVDEVVQHQQVAGLLELGAGADDLRLRLDRLQDLRRGQIPRQKVDIVLEQDVARDVDEDELAAADRLHAEDQSAVGHDLGAGLVRGRS